MSADDSVGYKRPPKSSQFRKGRSGNPQGRPRGARNVKTDLAEELGERIRITADGNHRRITKQQALIKALCARAIKGDTKAAALILNMIYRLFEPEQIAQRPSDFTPQDEKILEAFLQQHTQRQNNGLSE